jgi:glutathione S-transferase
MAETTPELLQFPYSHYNEKARWALDFKRIAHKRTNCLPGPHAFPVTRLTGQTAVPVVRFGNEALHGSARIIEELEKRFPQPPLVPADPALAKRALEIQAWFDEEVGPRVRRALFATLLNDPDYICRTFAADRSLLKRRLYRALFPLTRGVMKKGMGIAGAASVEDGYEGTREALDFVARAAGPAGHLVGDAFSVADLTAAALLAPTTMPEDSPMCLPEPRPAGVRRWLEHWAQHPGTQWVRDTYARHRPPSAQIPT